MKNITIIILFLTTLISCNSQNTTKQNTDITEKSYIDAIREKETEQQNKIQSILGDYVSSIEFKVKATGEELKDFEEGFIPWISIENPEKVIGKLIDADKIVIPNSEITLIIDYPLNNPAIFVLKNSKSGFTKKQLILEISKKYHEIYQNEESSAKEKTIPTDKRVGLINRNQTDGKYGIWGHDIGDLDLSSISVYKSKDGKIQITLGIES